MVRAVTTKPRHLSLSLIITGCFLLAACTFKWTLLQLFYEYNMSNESYLIRILKMTQGVLEAPVGQLHPVCHSLGSQESLAPQGAQEARSLFLLWVPETCHEEVMDHSFAFKIIN